MKNYHRLSLCEREKICAGVWAHEDFTTIARRINRSISTISREVWRDIKRYPCQYSAVRGDERARMRSHRGRKNKLGVSDVLRVYVYEKLQMEWSPEEIANRIKIDYPQDTIMRISHETIYRHLYCLPRGELKRELMRGLRRERKRRLARAALHYRRQKIQDMISISERPKAVRDRIIPGHWEGDLIVGKRHASALGSLVERTTRLTLLVPLEAKDAFAVRSAFAHTFTRIPKKFAKSLTYDRGSEMSQHALFTKDTKIKVFFADPQSPWQRGTNENTNGLIRQYFPKGTDFRTVTPAQIAFAEQRLNSRPRKVLGYRTPSESFYQLITKRSIALGD